MSIQGQFSLHHGNCLNVMPTLEAGSVDMVLTDPPYGTTACKWDSVIPFDSMWTGIKHAAKKNASIVMTASQPFTTTLISSNMKAFKYCWVWDKRTFANVACAKYQPLKIHEDIVVFGGKYKPQMVKGKGRMKGGKATGGDATGSLPAKYYWSDMYYPVSIIDIKTERGHHPTQKPVALMEYLIRTYTNEGDTVLDFTMGSGTTGVACANTGRKFIGIELDAGYFGIAKDRITNAYMEASKEIEQ